MAFIDDLKQKMEIDRLCLAVKASLLPKDGIVKINRDAAARLLELGGFKEIRKRDLTLFCKGIDEQNRSVVVLDGEFGWYQSSIDDVLVRKSPTVKEMISIRNAIRILKDNDVIRFKKEETVEQVSDAAYGTLNLKFTEKDISGILYSGLASMDAGEATGLEECLGLMAELLGWSPPPPVFGRFHQRIIGEKGKDTTDQPTFGPVVVFDRVLRRLFRTDEIFRVGLSEDRERFDSFVHGSLESGPDLEGEAVLRYLAARVLAGRGPYGRPVP